MSDNHKDLGDNGTDLNIDYNECCLFSIAVRCSEKICDTKRNWPRYCVYIDQLQGGVTDYLTSIKVINTQQQDLYSITEKELLMNRLSRIIDTEQPNLKICPNHRFTYGTGWSIPQSCVYLKEDGGICHVKSDRAAPMHLIKSVPTFPYGGKICSNHRNALYENDIQTIAATNPVSDVHSWEMVAEDPDRVNEMLIMLEQSPIKSQATQISILNQAPGSQRRLVAKFRRVLAASAMSIANTISPGEAEILIDMAGVKNVIGSRSSVTKPVSDDQMIQHLVDIYKAFEQKQYPYIERIQLLAILPRDMGYEEIMGKFGCSISAIKAARKLQLATTTPTHHQESEPIIRNRINPALTEHFLSWLLDTNMLTTVAWGVTKIKLDRGDVIEIPKQILQAKKSHVIHQYQMHCQEVSLQSLSDRSLRYILDGIGTSEQEALSGIDDIIKDAHEAWIKLEEICSSFKISKENRNNILSSIKESKLYLKALFTNHCSQEKTKVCTTHCTTHSLSQEGSVYYKEKCNHDHTVFCEDCANLITLLDFIDQQINQVVDIEEKNELQYDFQQAREAIIELMRHLIRAVQQNDSKSMLLDQMDEETVFLTIDWAQKVLQQKFREGQSEYYGKKGMSVLVASFTMKDSSQSKQGKFITKTYMLALSRCNQNELDTLSGGFLLLEQLKNEHPHINKIIKRSDNASVLGGHATFETEKIFCDKLCIKLLIRDYSEVQRGRSMCDRMAGAGKLRLRAWINAGNNLLTASDIKRGMEYCGGVKNVKIGVAELINNKTRINNAATIPEISLIRSVVYTDDGMIIRKASNIGQGRLIPYSNLQVTCNMKLIESFSSSNERINLRKQNERVDRQMNSFYFCPEHACISTFKDEAELNDHIALGQHVTIDDKMTTGDIAKVQLFDKLHDVNLSTTRNQSTASSSSTTTISFDQSTVSKTMQYFNSPGWALKTHKPRRPIDEAVKRFIKSIMDEEKLYSVKFSEKEFVRRIRTARQNNGAKTFSPDQYLTESQVKTQIKLLSKKSSNDSRGRKHIIHNDHADISEDENQYNKTPKLNRKQISIRTSTLDTSSAPSTSNALSTSCSQSSSDQNIVNEDLSDDDIDEEDEIAFLQEKQMHMVKKKVLAS